MRSNVSTFTLFFKRSCQQALVVSTLALSHYINIQSIETQNKQGIHKLCQSDFNGLL